MAASKWSVDEDGENVRLGYGGMSITVTKAEARRFGNQLLAICGDGQAHGKGATSRSMTATAPAGGGGRKKGAKKS